MSVNERLRKLREYLGLSQSRMAKELGVSLKTYQRYEQIGYDIPERALRQIEATFNVNPEWLRHGRGEMFLKKEEPARDPFEAAAEAVIDAIMEKRDIKLSPAKKKKVVKKLAELMKQIGEKEAIDLIDLAI